VGFRDTAASPDSFDQRALSNPLIVRYQREAFGPGRAADQAITGIAWIIFGKQCRQ
jgi:hypothetical protein